MKKIYTIKESTLEGFADSIRAINKSNNKMNTTQMKEELDKIPAILEEGEKIVYTEELDGPLNIPMDFCEDDDYFSFKVICPAYKENLYQLNKNQDNQVELTKINYLEDKIDATQAINHGFNSAISEISNSTHSVVDLNQDISEALTVEEISTDSVRFAYGLENDSNLYFIPSSIIHQAFLGDKDSIFDSLQIISENCGDILLFQMNLDYLASILRDAGYTVTK